MVFTLTKLKPKPRPRVMELGTVPNGIGLCAVYTVLDIAMWPNLIGLGLSICLDVGFGQWKYNMTLKGFPFILQHMHRCCRCTLDLEPIQSRLTWTFGDVNDPFTLYGISSYSVRNILSWLTQILKSPSVNSYGMLNPSAPYFLLSITTPWKRQSDCNKCLNSAVWKRKQK